MSWNEPYFEVEDDDSHNSGMLVTVFYMEVHSTPS